MSKADSNRGQVNRVDSADPLVWVDNLSTHFKTRSGAAEGKGAVVRAVDGVSFEIGRGETLGLVGESGCGKSTLGRSVLRLVESNSGRVKFDGVELSSLSQAQLRPLRRRMQIIFQDPVGSLNPRMTVRAMLGEPMRIHGLVSSSKEEEARVEALLNRVGMSADAMSRYPHEFSGGQRQRIGIARALSVGPEFVVADEPVSALDVSIQAQIINLLMDLQEESSISFLFIAHDLNVVEHISHRVAVMYLGRIVELAPSATLAANAQHPYTQALLEAVPQARAGNQRRSRRLLGGEVPSPIDPPSGCAFHPRCSIAKRGVCDRDSPPLRDLGAGHHVACHLVGSARP